MADVDTGDIIRVGALLDFEGVYDVVNVWHGLVTAGGGVSWASMVSRLQAWMNNTYAPLKSVLSDAMGTGALQVSNQTQGTTLGSIPWLPTWAGADTSEVGVPGVALFAWGRTLQPRVQIRKYFGVFGEGQLLDGFFITAARTGAQGAMDYHIADQTVGGGTSMQGVAYNRTLRTFTLAISADTQAEPAYQRRRKRGRGS